MGVEIKGHFCMLAKTYETDPNLFRRNVVIFKSADYSGCKLLKLFMLVAIACWAAAVNDKENIGMLA